MKIIEPPPMPRTKLFLYIFLLLLAILLLGLLKWYEQLTAERIWTIVVGVMLSLFIITSTDLIPEAARQLGQRTKRGKFKRFFGETSFKENVHLVFAHRSLNPNLLKADTWVTHYPAPKGNSAEGVNAWLAFQDIRAATFLSNSFVEMTGQDVLLTHDKYIDGDNFNYCAISIGLGFNGFTHWLSEQCGKQLFEIDFGTSPKDSNFETDLFKIDGKIPVIPKNKDVCLVARIVLRPYRGSSNRVCFVCAGRTAPGTAAAGFFLSKEWQKMMKLYKKHNKDLDLDSLVVVVQHNHDPFGSHEFDSSAVVDQELICWHIAAGLEKT